MLLVTCDSGVIVVVFDVVVATMATANVEPTSSSCALEIWVPLFVVEITGELEIRMMSKGIEAIDGNLSDLFRVFNRRRNSSNELGVSSCILLLV